MHLSIEAQAIWIFLAIEKASKEKEGLFLDLWQQ